MLAYLPTWREITVDLTQMTGPLVEVSWFDPITGSRRPAGLWQVTAEAVFTPPAAQDWVLLVETTTL